MLHKSKKNSNKKEKKNHKVKMQDLFIEAAEKIEIAINYMCETIVALCNENLSEVKKYSNLTIKTEKEADRLYEQIIERMYSRETLVFSRPDRLYLSNQIEKVIDKAELVVRRIGSYTPSHIPELADLLIETTNISKQIGTLLKETVIKVFTDFDAADNLANKIEDIRRDIRKIEWDFLKKLYKIKPDFPDLLFYDNLIQIIAITIDKAEEFADGINGLICKYRL